SAAKRARVDFGAEGIAAPAIGSADQLGDSRRLSQRCWRLRICIGPIRPHSICCAVLPNAARCHPCSFSSPPGRSFGHRGACARTTVSSPWRPSTANRCGTWSPICATSRAEPSRSSRAVNDCCSVGGIAWIAGMMEDAPLQTALERLAEADILLVQGLAREIGQAATLMVALGVTTSTHIFCGNYATANAQADELVALEDEKSLYWKAV